MWTSPLHVGCLTYQWSASSQSSTVTTIFYWGAGLRRHKTHLIIGYFSRVLEGRVYPAQLAGFARATMLTVTPTPSSPSVATHRAKSLFTADVVIVGAGPAGAAAGYWAAKAGMDALIVDMAELPDLQPDSTAPTRGRDKTCGDGLTPRAIKALAEMDALHILEGRPEIDGLKLHGFGGSITTPWPEGSFPTRGSAIPRSELDVALLHHAVRAGARAVGSVKLLDATLDTPHSITQLSGVNGQGEPVVVRGKHYLLAEGVRGGISRQVGVRWLREMVHGVAARSYVDTPRGTEPWIHSHLELRDENGVAQPGYGWVFPLGEGAAGDGVGPRANLGCGALTTSARPAKVNTKKLLHHYANQIRDEWQCGQPQAVTSALLPMGGAVTRVAGVNWATLGDTAALINPLNGEGIDYALESAQLVVGLLADATRNADGLRFVWPNDLREHYGAAFSLARRLAIGLTMPGLMSVIGPLGMRGPLSPYLMGSAARLMGNLVTPEDADLTARVWRGVGGLSRGADRLLAADSRPLFGTEMR